MPAAEGRMTDTFPENRLERILATVETIEESLGVLAQKQCISHEAYLNDSDTRDIVERRFVKITEATIDIGEEPVKYERGTPPKSNPSTMRTLGELDILSSTTAEKMAQAARFRNVLSHTYGDIIDHNTVYRALQDLDRYRSFVAEVREYLDMTGAFDGPNTQ
jgi:uncharacterized protein YutE (UPF0331/DUF86 family)